MKDISSEILIIYGLIIFIVALIVFIVLLDKKEKKKRFMTRTQELRLMDLRKTEEDYTEEFKKQPIAREVELKSVEPVQKEELEEVEELQKTEDIVVKQPIVQEEEVLSIDEDMYIEDDLEKTSAQIQLELLAQELEKAKEKEADKIRKFEEEQEENAIISYNELLKVCDDLYDKNEKVQYMDEGNEPINLEELKSRFQQVTNLDSKNYSRAPEIELLD